MLKPNKKKQIGGTDVLTAALNMIRSMDSVRVSLTNEINDLKNLYPLNKIENRNIGNKYIKFNIDAEYIKTITPWIQKYHLPSIQTYL